MGLEMDGSNVKALFRRAQAFAGTKDYVEAVADLKRAMEIEPQNKDVRGEYKRVRARRRSRTRRRRGCTRACSRRWRRRATAAAAAATPRPRMGTAPPRRRTARRAAAASRRRPARRAAAERDASDAAAKKVAPGDRLSPTRGWIELLGRYYYHTPQLISLTIKTSDVITSAHSR